MTTTELPMMSVVSGFEISLNGSTGRSTSLICSKPTSWPFRMLPASNAGSKTAPSTTYGTTPGALSSGPTTNRKTGDGPTTAGETQCAAVKTQRDVIAVPVHVPDPLLVVEITSPTAGHCGLV